MTQPWDPMEGEPNLWYQRFCSFRSAGPTRSILKTYQAWWRSQHNLAQTDAVSNPQSVPSSWSRYSAAWNWRERAAAWDRHLSKIAEKEAEEKFRERIMSPEEVLAILSDMARANISEFTEIDKNGASITLKEEALKKRGNLVRSISTSRGKTNSVRIDLYDAQSAARTLGEYHRIFGSGRREDESQSSAARTIAIPADLIAPDFLVPYRDIRAKRHTEYVFEGGRGSTKSSFVSEAFIFLLVNNPQIHGIVLRQVGETLRDSVYAQLTWAISELDVYFPGIDNDFKRTTSPLEITYMPTGQKIYFRGADDAGKIKSIKPPFGYIGLAWFEELDQFHGPEAVRKIEQSAIRGGDEAWIFKSFNPPSTASNWANKYVKIPKANQLLHHSTYLTVPVEWLGRPFIEEAEHLKEVNPAAYEHEYLGVANAIGGMVFTNVELREITDDEIKEFDRIYQGIDWGYYPDPVDWGKMHYNAATMTLYIFDEFRAWRSSNADLYAELVNKKGVTPQDLIICDSEDPKSIADLREYGLNAIGAEKGPGSVDYSMKWLQSLRKIVIDPRRCPYSADEFLNYEFEKTKDDEIINEYPDRDNHAIDRTRYAMNLVWRKRGK